MSLMPKTTDVIIVAAGRGQRAGALRDGLPKQYAPVAGRPLLAWTLDRFAAHAGIRRIQVVIGDGQDRDYRAVVPVDAPKLLPPVTGGMTRQASVRAGLDALAADPPDLVLIHDAARPFVPEEMIDAMLAELGRGAAGVLPLAPIADTLRHVTPDGGLGETLDRDRVGAVQTPQGFAFPAILAAHRATPPGVVWTDDAQTLEAAGHEVVAMTGAPGNVKLTYPEDIAMAAARLSPTRPAPVWETRIGQGYDVHRFGPGDHVILCGVHIPFGKALIGHSDADVGLHALTDALFGALGDGDIGTHFPPSDPQWKGASSDRFLIFARERVVRCGGRIVNADLTFVCEAPKIGPRRAEMIAATAPLLGVPPARLSIKATTSERLGFTGRGEGIAALASVSIALPADPEPFS